ncbi:MAG: 50S ribosomal protein L6 [Candidatus Spechtbacteria bacterium]|nr:50S ribosomal protein L6 [Candidatus Spechtbacteria bacterium]
MSRIGKKPIVIPDKVEVDIEGKKIKTKGPLGELGLELPAELGIEKRDNVLVLELANKTPKNRALWGLFRSLTANTVIGVSEGFEKQLDIEGVGYRAEVKDKDLVMQLGYSHPVIMPVPEGLKVSVEKSTITVSGTDKQKVGQFAADIRSKRKPEPYKGKGIRYKGEYVRRKAGKRAATTGA